MVVACIALGVSLGGTSYATITQVLPRGAVGSVQLRNNSVTSEKVRDFSLRLWDFKRGQLPRGPAGPAGPAGPQGPAGGIGNLVLHQSSVLVPANAAGNGLYATRAITGGTSWSSDADDSELITVYSKPIVESKRVVGWRARGGTDINQDRTFTVQVLCVAG